MSSKMSFGITFLPQFPPETLVDYARQAEAAGFDILWLWEDCFYAGAFTSAATILAGTETIKVGIGILPATVRNPLFAAMEITTLASLYPGRFIPGFGHGVESWMKQIGAYPKSTLKALEETVISVRSLLSGEETTLLGSHVHLDHVKLKHTPQQVPALYVGGIREKTLRLAGRIADGTILTGMSSPAYVRWANTHIAEGTAVSGLAQNIRSVAVACKISRDGTSARTMARRWLIDCIGDGEPHLFALGLEEEAPRLVRELGPVDAAKMLPDSWVDELSASGTPEQAAGMIKRLIDAGSDSVVLMPIESDPANLQETILYLMPLLKEM
jgi:5,10-methylenetetrahydromethanopterin reductase